MQKKNPLKKLIVTIVVALGVALAAYLGLDISEEDIKDTVAPIVEQVIDGDEAEAPAGPEGEVVPPVPAEELPFDGDQPEPVDPVDAEVPNEPVDEPVDEPTEPATE